MKRTRGAGASGPTLDLSRARQLLAESANGSCREEREPAVTHRSAGLTRRAAAFKVTGWGCDTLGATSPAGPTNQRLPFEFRRVHFTPPLAPLLFVVTLRWNIPLFELAKVTAGG